jgi:putative hemolysin
VDITIWIELALFVFLMGLSGFFSSSETSLFSLNKIQLDQMRRDGNPSISLIERLLSQPRRLIVTILIGNEFVNVAASVISAAIVIQLLGAENKLVNLFIMIPILLVIGEITPKTLAIRSLKGTEGLIYIPSVPFNRRVAEAVIKL